MILSDNLCKISKEILPNTALTSSDVTCFETPSKLNWSRSEILSLIPPAEFFAIVNKASSEILIFSSLDIYLKCLTISSVVILLKSNL